MLRSQTRFLHGTLVAGEASREPGQANVAHKPDVPVAETDQVSRGVVASLNIIRKDHVAFGVRNISHHVVTEHNEGNTPLDQQLQQIPRVCAGEDYTPHQIMALHYLGYV